MRARITIAIAALSVGFGHTAQAAYSDRIMSVATITFIAPKTISPLCQAHLEAAATEQEATSALNACKIGFDRDHFSRLKSKTPDYDAALAAAPIGKVVLTHKGPVSTYTVIQQERVLSMASLNDAFPIRRVLYEGVLDGAMQTALTPIHDMDGVIKILRDHHVVFVEDGGTLLARSVPADIVKTLTDQPGEPIVVQAKDHGTIYARRMAPRQQATGTGDGAFSNP